MLHNVDMHSSSIDYALQWTADQTNHRGGSQPPILRHKYSWCLLPELNDILLNDYILHKRHILCLIPVYSSRSTDSTS